MTGTVLPLFQTSWQRAWCGLTGQAADLALRDHLLTCYAEPQRRYHTREHLAECLALFEASRALAQRPHEVELALWFHDAVYALGAPDNEARSAAWAQVALLQADVPADVAERVQALVLATRHEAQPDDADQQLLVDIDLAILATPAERFERYQTDVRAEYASVPDAAFWPRRRAVLEGFLDRPTLYGTPVLRAAWEQRARDQLQRALAAIGRGATAPEAGPAAAGQTPPPRTKLER